MKTKFGFCEECNCGRSEPVALIAGLCKNKYWRNRRKINEEKRKKRGLDITGKKNPVNDSELTLFYKKMMSELAPVCENCGMENKAIVKSQNRWQSCIAHVLPKSIFKSLETDKRNVIVLFSGFSAAGCHCHDKYDSSWDSATKMAIWPKAIKIIRELYPELPDKEKAKVPDILMCHILGTDPVILPIDNEPGFMVIDNGIEICRGINERVAWSLALSTMQNRL